MREINVAYRIELPDDFYGMTQVLTAYQAVHKEIAMILGSKFGDTKSRLLEPIISDGVSKPASKKGRPPKAGISIVRNDAA